MYEAHADPYCYPGTTVLKNIPGIRNQAALDEFTEFFGRRVDLVVRKDAWASGKRSRAAAQGQLVGVFRAGGKIVLATR